ncbi:MAG: hypothetical protein A3J66_01695 [Candidatus Magasanikbacteria bacterium RIFCSPHIGHO2_02_FULL_47_14]|uniref:Ornithine cyclodeaminase family protein n=1 Tax=Candidatus Magasanikbacteria bacterium RIFCSPHIGHO2_02_FULL_47_14 TaxID=1798680 RepID=A0A1F6MA23_9BACT|nr:MAG: hypothetical protein A3J66_01695 [Candidatus Magasanikbacteria bacterium RIFCSPHIGHO2_02_FULL_47_14]
MRIINKEELKKSLSFTEAVGEIEKAFSAVSQGKVAMPPPLVFELPECRGEICIKTAFAPELPTYTIKQVSVFSKNAYSGLPTLTGTMNVFDSTTGMLLAVIDEGGWLTNLRTACAGAVADKYFRTSRASALGIIGAGAQAEFQLRVILSLNKNYTRVYIWNRTPEKAKQLIKKLRQDFQDIIFETSETISHIVAASDTVITVTPSTEPLITADLIQNGKTFIGVGADMPEKCEIEPAAYKKADKIFVDDIQSNVVLGSIARGLKENTLTLEDITGEIGEVIGGKKQGRTDDRESIVVTLVGIGAQDTYIGNYAYNELSGDNKTSVLR